ncbi:biopolymer transporter ExbD [bacterium]|nr:biopolymer transporter ExbD [bacterium]
MAYRPSKRQRHGMNEADANITPMMNLMVVLIPLLLTSAEFVKLGVIELNLPPAASGEEAGRLDQIPQESIKRLDLSVTITDQGFFISSAMAVLGGPQAGDPTIAMIFDDKGVSVYDFSALSRKLYEIKEASGTKFPDSEQIILLAEDNINYQTVISTMDAARTFQVDGRSIELFPEVSLSAGVF